jgi:uncharacterized RDD family membrane protein YckC
MNQFTTAVKIASKTKRLIAFLLDYIAIQTIIFTYVYTIEEISYWSYLNRNFDFFEILKETIIALLYGLIIYPVFSGNLGHKIMGLKVINKTNFNKFYEGACREFLKNVSIFLILPSIWIFFDSKNQNIYDKLFKTIVVEHN